MKGKSYIIGTTGTGDLLLRIDPIEVLDRKKAPPRQHDHCRVGHLAAERAQVYGEAWVLRQLVKVLYEHATTPLSSSSGSASTARDPELACREVAGTAGVVS